MRNPSGSRSPALPPDNVVILTAGLTGSSVVAGLLHEAGYWTGAATAQKPDYNTFENDDLVRLNDRLLAAAGHRERFDRVFQRAQIEALLARLADTDRTPYRAFVAECERHRPWLWKDPRLWLTVRFWAPLLARERLRVIVLSREPLQAWVSHILRRQIQSPAYLRAYMDGIRRSLIDFAGEFGLPCLELTYEDLLVAPQATVARLGAFLATEVPLAALQRVYNGRLGRRRHGALDHLRAGLVYARNYRGRERP